MVIYCLFLVDSCGNTNFLQNWSLLLLFVLKKCVLMQISSLRTRLSEEAQILKKGGEERRVYPPPPSFSIPSPTPETG